MPPWRKRKADGGEGTVKVQDIAIHLDLKEFHTLSEIFGHMVVIQIWNIRHPVVLEVWRFLRTIVDAADDLCAESFWVLLSWPLWSSGSNMAPMDLDGLGNNRVRPSFGNLCQELTLLSLSRSTCPLYLNSCSCKYCRSLGVTCNDCSSRRQSFQDFYKQASCPRLASAPTSASFVARVTMHVYLSNPTLLYFRITSIDLVWRNKAMDTTK